MIPGSNLLKMAMRIIASQTFLYYAFQSRTTTDIGQDISTYASPVNVQGNVQPVPRALFQVYGLDEQKNYVTIYIPASILDVARDVTGDQFLFNGNRFQAISKTDWYAMDGWVAVLCVQIEAAG